MEISSSTSSQPSQQHEELESVKRTADKEQSEVKRDTDQIDAHSKEIAAKKTGVGNSVNLTV